MSATKEEKKIENVKLFIDSERSFVVAKDQIIEGGRLDEKGNFSGYIDPKTYVLVTPELAKFLKEMYPKEIMNIDELSKRGYKAKAKATAEDNSFEESGQA